MENNLGDKISVIVPIYKVEAYLSKCVESIMHQTYSNLEIILVDDGSPDKCPGICDDCAKLDTRIKVIHKTNGGLSSARNAGMAIATGTFLAFVDSDDYLEPEMYEKLMQKQRQNNSDIVLCRFNEVKDGIVYQVYESMLEDFCQKKDFRMIYSYSNQFKYKNNIKYIKNNIPAYIWRGVYRASLFKNLSFYEKVFCMEDCLAWTKILKNQSLKISLVDDYLYNYLVRTSSITHNTNTDHISNDISYIGYLSSILNENCYSELINSVKFFCFTRAIIKKIIHGTMLDITPIAKWGNALCYKSNKKYTHGIKLRFKNFLIYHKCYWLLRFFYQFRR